MSRLRPFQRDIKAGVFNAWGAGRRNVLVKSATGTGKTVIMADIFKTVDRAAAAIAHRGELVSQISTALAREGVRHRIIGSESVRKSCVTSHMEDEDIGRSFYDPNARVGVCSIDTLIGQDAKRDPWFSQVGLWAQDEAHHVQVENKWGRGASMFPNAYGMGFTALAWRADGGGLGTGQGGVFDELVRGPEMSDQIARGYLTSYVIFAPPSDVDYSQVTVTASGDLSPAKLRAAVHASDKIVGDVVKHYRRVSMEKLGRLGLGITFAVDVEAAKEIAAAFNADGVPAEIITDKTPGALRRQILRRFKRREVLQLVNVDLFGEGFDLPAIEIVSMVRKTESLQLYVQQFGRVLRPMLTREQAAAWGDMTDEQRLHILATGPKPYGIVIDHVGNVCRHGLPDALAVDSLDKRRSRSASENDAIPTRVCANVNVNGSGLVCAKTYERYYPACPFCGFYPEPAQRSAPQFVDGDLFELDAATLAALRGKVIDLQIAPAIPRGLNPIQAGGFHRQHLEKTKAQHYLREAMSLWAGWQRALGHDDQQAYRKFFHAFGIDALGAQALGRADAESLTLRIQAALQTNMVTSL